MYPAFSCHRLIEGNRLTNPSTQRGRRLGNLEGLNGVFSALKRKACGYRSTVYMITVLYLVAGKLKIPAPAIH